MQPLKDYYEKFCVFILKQQSFTIAILLYEALLAKKIRKWIKIKIIVCWNKEKFKLYYINLLIEFYFKKKFQLIFIHPIYIPSHKLAAILSVISFLPSKALVENLLIFSTLVFVDTSINLSWRTNPVLLFIQFICKVSELFALLSALPNLLSKTLGETVLMSPIATFIYKK